MPLVQANEEELEAYGGDYGLPNGLAVRVRAGDGALEVEPLVEDLALPFGEMSLRPVGDDRFLTKVEGMLIMVDFPRAEDGSVGWFRAGGRLMPRTD